MTNLDNFLGGLTKILKEQCPEDIQLKAGLEDTDKSAPISVHKLVLSARSEVFKKMLESDEFKSCGELETVTLSDMNQEELKALVEFIYSNGSFSSQKLKQHVKSVYIAADKYGIPHLRDVCRNEMINSMITSNALEILEISQVPFDKALNDAALGFIINNLKAISKLREFQLFLRRQPELVLKIVKTAGSDVRENKKYVMIRVQRAKNLIF